MTQNKTQPKWIKSNTPVDYQTALEKMKLKTQQIRLGNQSEQIWLLKHPPIYTAGTSAQDKHLIKKQNIPIIKTNRGGQWTYHDPGQRIIYIMLDLDKRGHDIKRFVKQIEAWAIDSLKELDIQAQRRKNYPGVWIENNTPKPPDKITAIGIRITKWVSWHGMAINFDPDLNAYQNIIPCGTTNGGITSIKKLNPNATMDDLDTALAKTFSQNFPIE